METSCHVFVWIRCQVLLYCMSIALLCQFCCTVTPIKAVLTSWNPSAAVRRTEISGSLHRLEKVRYSSDRKWFGSANSIMACVQRGGGEREVE